MTLKGRCKILRIYVDENIKWKGQLWYRAVVEKFLSMGMAGATVFKGVEGFGFSARIHSAQILEITENLPVLVEVTETPGQIAKALKFLESILPEHCLVTVQDVRVIHHRAAQNPKKKSS
jgi:PII-like signaling protein